MCRNTIRHSLAMVVLLAFIGLVAAANISHAQNNQTRQVMRQKLQHSEALLAALVTSDWDSLDRNGRALEALTTRLGWQVLRLPEFRRGPRTLSSGRRPRLSTRHARATARRPCRLTTVSSAAASSATAMWLALASRGMLRRDERPERTWGGRNSHRREIPQLKRGLTPRRRAEIRRDLPRGVPACGLLESQSDGDLAASAEVPLCRNRNGRRPSMEW